METLPSDIRVSFQSQTTNENAEERIIETKQK